MGHIRHSAPLLAASLAASLTLAGCATPSPAPLTAPKEAPTAREPALHPRLHAIAAAVCDEGVDDSQPEHRCAACPNETAPHTEQVGRLRVVQLNDWLLVSVDGCQHADSMPATRAGTFLLREAPKGWTKHYWEDLALAACAARDHEGQPALWCDAVTEWGDATHTTTYIITAPTDATTPDKLQLPTHDCLRPECAEELVECWDEGRWREERDPRDGATVFVWQGSYTAWTPRGEHDGTCQPLEAPHFEMEQRAVVERWEQREGKWVERPAP